jgi:hypothetical protein
MVATAQRFSETHPGTDITWVKRSLQEFADYPIAKLAESYDLLVLDHPFMGHVAKHRMLLPLDEHLSPAFLSEQERNSVGVSHPSYFYDGHHWALAIDAATPVSGGFFPRTVRSLKRIPGEGDETYGDYRYSPAPLGYGPVLLHMVQGLSGLEP